MTDGKLRGSPHTGQMAGFVPHPSIRIRERAKLDPAVTSCNGVSEIRLFAFILRLRGSPKDRRSSSWQAGGNGAK
ncbi:hypothetical protein CVT25_000624 [Psilocybe cyanescens]|uniref:Uncharacterized protein n=1 Tax=Psilocybe cyanescens TaxID=93625 RepID=A0A409XWD7_PSICY|nr:hypothetical protein CVT25_000624 [Psilocybe cyanescens]